MRLRVINANGTPVTWLASLVRNLLRTVDILPFCYAFGLIATLIDPRGRRIGDLVAGTWSYTSSRPRNKASRRIVPVVHAPVMLQPGERAAIVEFAPGTRGATDAGSPAGICCSAADVDPHVRIARCSAFAWHGRWFLGAALMQCRRS